MVDPNLERLHNAMAQPGCILRPDPVNKLDIEPSMLLDFLRGGEDMSFDAQATEIYQYLRDRDYASLQRPIHSLRGAIGYVMAYDVKILLDETDVYLKKRVEQHQKTPTSTFILDNDEEYFVHDKVLQILEQYMRLKEFIAEFFERPIKCEAEIRDLIPKTQQLIYERFPSKISAQFNSVQLKSQRPPPPPLPPPQQAQQVQQQSRNRLPSITDIQQSPVQEQNGCCGGQKCQIF